LREIAPDAQTYLKETQMSTLIHPVSLHVQVEKEQMALLKKKLIWKGEPAAFIRLVVKAANDNDLFTIRELMVMARKDS